MRQPDDGPLGGHPRGTLAVIVIYGLLFAAGWFILYLAAYTPRGGIAP